MPATKDPSPPEWKPEAHGTMTSLPHEVIRYLKQWAIEGRSWATRHGHVHQWRPAVVQLSEEELETALTVRPVP